MQILINGIKRQLATILNLGDPGDGMKKLSEENENSTNRVRSNDLVTAEGVLATARKIVDDLATANLNQAPPTPPIIILKNNAYEEADRLNTISQAIIDAKEGTTRGITAIVGRPSC